MVADLNLLGSVGDLYCISNTFSMLLYVAPICCPSCFLCIMIPEIFPNETVYDSMHLYPHFTIHDISKKFARPEILT